MTLDEIVTEVAERLNLTSDTAIARINRDVQECYRQVLGTVGLGTSTRGVVTTDTAVDYRYATFNGIQKLLSVYRADGPAPQVLQERTFNQLRDGLTGSGTPWQYAIASVDSNSTTVFFDLTPDAIETLSADALVDASTLTGNDEPIFPSIYHDILVYGAKRIELEKLEKPDLADRARNDYERRLADLRYFLAKSAWLDTVQGGGSRWNRRGLVWGS